MNCPASAKLLACEQWHRLLLCLRSLQSLKFAFIYSFRPPLSRFMLLRKLLCQHVNQHHKRPRHNRYHYQRHFHHQHLYHPEHHLTIIMDTTVASATSSFTTATSTVTTSVSSTYSWSVFVAFRSTKPFPTEPTRRPFTNNFVALACCRATKTNDGVVRHTNFASQWHTRSS